MRRLRLAIAVVLAACGSDSQEPDPPPPPPPPPPPGEARIELRVGTAGSWNQSGQYAIVLDGAFAQRWAIPGQSTILTVQPGAHAVGLSGLPAWCSAAESPRSVEVAAGTTALAEITVTCTGASVTIVTTGDVPDRDGYQLVEGEGTGTALTYYVGANDSQVIGVPPGRRLLSLQGMAPHCRAARDAWEVEVEPTGANPILIEVACASATLMAEVIPTGLDLDLSYVARLEAIQSDGYQTSALATGRSSLPLGSLPVGATFTVTLSDVAPNCRVAEATRAGAVSGTDTIVARFEVSCTALPAPGILFAVNFYDYYYYSAYSQAYRYVDQSAPPFIVAQAQEAEWSPNGMAMAFTELQAGPLGAVGPYIVLASRSDTNRTTLAPGTQPDFAPDGSSVFHLEPYACPFGCNYPDRVLRVRISDRASSVAFTDTDIVAFDVSADGGRIAYVREVSTAFELVVANLDGSDRRVLARDVTARRPRFSPDGQEILAEALQDFVNYRWFAVRADGGGRRLVRDVTATAAAWSPDGSRIALGEYGALVTVRSSDGGDRREVGSVYGEINTISWR